MKVETQRWLDIAADDYDLGLFAFEKGFYAQAIYLLCQAIEKALKALQIEYAHIAPKKIHRLELIAQDTGIPVSDEQVQVMTNLSKHYAKVRYPDYARTDYNTEAKVEPIVRSATTLFLWTLEQFKNR